MPGMPPSTSLVMDKPAVLSLTCLHPAGDLPPRMPTAGASKGIRFVLPIPSPGSSLLLPCQHLAQNFNKRLMSQLWGVVFFFFFKKMNFSF